MAKKKHGTYTAKPHKGPGDTRKQPCPSSKCKGMWTWQVLIDIQGMSWLFGHDYKWKCKVCGDTYAAE